VGVVKGGEGEMVRGREGIEEKRGKPRENWGNGVEWRGRWGGGRDGGREGGGGGVIGRGLGGSGE